MSIKLDNLIKYIKDVDSYEERKALYPLKLNEEVGELNECVRQLTIIENNIPSNEISRKNLNYDDLIENLGFEIYDVLHNLISIANTYNIDLEKAIRKKIDYNNKKYKRKEEL